MLKFTRYAEVTRIDSARTIAGRGYYWTTAYLVGGLLVDSGCAHTARDLAAHLRTEPLTCLINTHTHEDHFGANGHLQTQRTDLKIFAHPLALPVLENPRKAQPLQLYRRVFWGWPKPSTAQPVADGDLIDAGKYRYQVIYTPGHSPDHICLYEPERGWLFTGDLFVGGRDRALRAGYDIWQIIASLKRVAALPLARLFPGSARVRDNPHQALAEKIAYLEETGCRVLELSRQGLDVSAIARRLFGGPMWIELITAGHFTRSWLVRSYLSH
jgi:glyoxylase-like metal-dependent hydrolase (beta-lactamase superfamily II)